MHHGKITKPIADGLIELRKRIEKGGIPSSKLDETLNLATCWNIREFGCGLGVPSRRHTLPQAALRAPPPGR